MMWHCWPSPGPDKMYVSLKWPTCKIANMAQISQIKCGPFLVKMRCSQVCVFWMWASFGLSVFFLVDIQLACGPDLGNRSGPPKCHHSMRYVGWMKVPKLLDLGRSNFAIWVDCKHAISNQNSAYLWCDSWWRATLNPFMPYMHKTAKLLHHSWPHAVTEILVKLHTGPQLNSWYK